MDKTKSPKLGRKSQQIDRVARELHLMAAYSALIAVNSFTKANDENISQEKREEALATLSDLISFSETLYDDLSDERKQIYINRAKEIL